MTSSRVIRSTKGKMFLYVCAVLTITGLIACYNSTLTQLDEVKRANDVCRQHQENLSTQLQVISDYKQKIDKELKKEKAEHQQTKNNLEIKINEEKSRSQKLTNDALLKYNSLQQHYSLLETQHEDFKEESSKTQKKQLEEVNSLQAKLKEIEEELKKVKASKETIKTRVTELELENVELKKALDLAKDGNDAQQKLQMYTEEYRVLQEKYSALREKCGEPPEDNKKPSEKSLLNLPLLKLAENPSSSTKAGPKVSSSQFPLNGAKPLNVPSVTPESAKKEANLKPPQGVVEAPENREDQNEQPQLQKKIYKIDDLEKDNVAQEVFDAPNMEGMAFQEDSLKQGANFEQKKDFIGNKKLDEIDYKDLQREEEVDDDMDDYGDHRRAEDVAVRN